LTLRAELYLQTSRNVDYQSFVYFHGERARPVLYTRAMSSLTGRVRGQDGAEY
jgi:hypothetical protein